MTNESNAKTLPDWMRRRFSDGQRFLVLCVVAGLACALVAVAIQVCIRQLFNGLWAVAAGMDPLWFGVMMISAPTLAGLLIGVSVQKFAPEAVGSGIPQTKIAYYNKGGKISGRAGIWRFCLGILYVGLGNSLGREGPTVHASAAVASRLGRWVFRDPARVQAMLPVGMAAGIAAAFNAPLSALMFVFEELLDNFSMKALGGMVVAVVVAAAVSRTIIGEEPVLPAKMMINFTTSTWMFVGLPMGLAAGLIGHLFTSSTLRLRKAFKSQKFIPSWLTPAVGGLSCGILGLTAFSLTGYFGNAQNSVFSIGYQSLEAAFEFKLGVVILALLLVFKSFAVVVNYASGGSGGLFGPTLYLGGMLGGLVGVGLADFQHLVSWIPAFPAEEKVIGGCVLLGMGAMFAAVVRCPITSLIIIFEMTGNYSLILPLMAGNMIAWQIAKHLHPVGLYDALILQDGVVLRRATTYRGAMDYRNLPVQAIMSYDVFALAADETPAAALKRIAASNKNFRAYPVIDADGVFRGVVNRETMAHSAAETTLGELLAEEEIRAVHLDSTIREAAHRMIAGDLRQVPVTSATDPTKLVGWLTLNDIARQQNAAEG
jgi:CIC family chloride channel protein